MIAFCSKFIILQYRQQLNLQTIALYIQLQQQTYFRTMSNSSLISSKKYSDSCKINQKTAITETTSKICQNCKIIKEELQAEIFNLKNKAHQSFMQVIQVQQLHEQQLQLMKQEYQQQTQNSRKQISKLQDALKLSKQQVQIIQKNLKQHTYDLDNDSFLVQNIQIIHCHQNQKSYLNDSSLSQFTEFLSNGLNENISLSGTNVNLKQTKNDIIKQLNKSGLQSLPLAVQKKLQYLYNAVSQLQNDISGLQQKNQNLKRQKEDYQNKYNTIKANYDSLFKQSKFMSDHIRNISSQKLRLERKVKEIQKQLNQKKVVQSQHPINSHNHLLYSQQSYSPTIKISINHPNSVCNSSDLKKSKQCSPLLQEKNNPYLNIKNYDYFVDQESSSSINNSTNLKQKSVQEQKKGKKLLQKSSPYRRQLTVSENYQRQEEDKSMMKQIREGLKLKTLMKKSQTNIEKPIRGNVKKTSLHLPAPPNMNSN